MLLVDDVGDRLRSDDAVLRQADMMRVVAGVDVFDVDASAVVDGQAMSRKIDVHGNAGMLPMAAVGILLFCCRIP